MNWRALVDRIKEAAKVNAAITITPEEVKALVDDMQRGGLR